MGRLLGAGLDVEWSMWLTEARVGSAARKVSIDLRVRGPVCSPASISNSLQRVRSWPMWQ